MAVRSTDDVRKRTGAQTDRIERLLGEAFPNARVEAYRYNSASIRVRIVDEVFRGLDRVRREELVLPHIHQLPQSIQPEITMLVLLTPEELAAGQSMVNAEFEDPSPTLL